ncbi:MAG: adenylosuccinate lyase [Bacillota bacterium]|nr:adenylosuccinate lyase [Bacillota bacterium]
MIERYTLPSFRRLWSDEQRWRLWLEVELAALEAQAELGVVPAGVPAAIRSALPADPEGRPLLPERLPPRIAEIEARVQHDVIAFVSALAEQVGEAGRWLHHGLTSYDVVDTALGLQLRQAFDLLVEELDGLRLALRRQAERWAYQPMAGRTHGMIAEPVTLGLKLALDWEELGRDRERLLRARRAVAVGRLAGAVGTYASGDPRWEERVCRRLGLEPAPISSQVLGRDRHAEALSAVAITGGTLERMAVDLRGLARSEVGELLEPFPPGKKGSSAMPHKRNPERSERVTGLARLLRGYALAALENQALWHERDISHSSVERVILPDATSLLGYMLRLERELVEGLEVRPGAMARNLDLGGGVIHSERVLTALVASGMTREEAYARVQAHALRALDGGPEFRRALAEDPEVVGRLGRDGLAACFDLGSTLRHIPTLFARLGLEAGGAGGAAGARRGSDGAGGAAASLEGRSEQAGGGRHGGRDGDAAV